MSEAVLELPSAGSFEENNFLLNAEGISVAIKIEMRYDCDRPTKKGDLRTTQSFYLKDASKKKWDLALMFGMLVEFNGTEMLVREAKDQGGSDY